MTEDRRDDIARRVRRAIRDVPDFPAPGIIFKDITPVLSDPALFDDVVTQLMADLDGTPVDVVVGIESRGFIFGAPMALRMGRPFVPVRKPGKLPREVARVEYALEYGTDSLEAHRDALSAGQRVLIVDDLLATGGTAAATAQLIEELGGDVVGAAFVVELAFLDGRERLTTFKVRSLVTYG